MVPGKTLVNKPHRVGEQIDRSCGGCKKSEARRWSRWISSEGIPQMFMTPKKACRLAERGLMSMFHESLERCREAVKNVFLFNDFNKIHKKVNAIQGSFYPFEELPCSYFSCWC